MVDWRSDVQLGQRRPTARVVESAAEAHAPMGLLILTRFISVVGPIQLMRAPSTLSSTNTATEPSAEAMT